MSIVSIRKYKAETLDGIAFVLYNDSWIIAPIYCVFGEGLVRKNWDNKG